MQKKLFLLDAFALIFRAYYALIRNPRITSKGRNANAQFGFTNTLIDLINNQKPTHMAVCFDTHALTERHTDFADYKANRQETPEDILSAVPDIKRIIEALNIPVVAIDGYEEDDVIGALAKQAEKEGYEVYMVTPDKDYGQLVSKNIKIYKPPYQGGSAEILGPEEICVKWGINNVSQVIDMLGLMGDAVDNIPVIKGIGEKKLLKLFPEFVNEEKYSFQYMMETAKQKIDEHALYGNIINFKHQLDINRQLMDLTNPVLTEEAVDEIEALISSSPFKYNKTNFLRMYNEDFLGNSIPNVEFWLSNTFSYLTAYK